MNSDTFINDGYQILPEFFNKSDCKTLLESALETRRIENIFLAKEDFKKEQKFKEEKDLRASDIVHLRNNVKLRKYPAWAFVLPWDKLSLQEKFESHPDSFYRNRSQNGLIFENN